MMRVKLYWLLLGKINLKFELNECIFRLDKAACTRKKGQRHGVEGHLHGSKGHQYNKHGTQYCVTIVLEVAIWLTTVKF